MASSIFFFLIFFEGPLTSAARGSTVSLITCAFPLASVTVFSRKHIACGKLSAGSPSASTARIWSFPLYFEKRSISFAHHKDSFNLGEQMTISQSEFCRASLIGSDRLSARGSSSVSRKTLLILCCSLGNLSRRFLGSEKASRRLWIPDAISESSSLCL